MPDFKAIHNKNFNKGENLSENVHRVQQRHLKLAGAKSDDNHNTNENVETSMSANLLNHASNLLKKIVPFSKEENASKVENPKDSSNIPKFVSYIH